MEIVPIVQWIAFAIFAFVSVAGALGMATTMSMYRSGLFLMASFIGVAGLFILLLAPLLSLLQVMMYVGGMLVMILFMLLFSSDPGGAMMTAHMELRGLEKLFSQGIIRKQKSPPEPEHQPDPEPEHQPEHGGGHGGMDMSMFTPAKRPALLLAPLAFLLLALLLVLRPDWPVAPHLPDEDSARRIGELLMGRYMIAFEGAGLLILLGVFGAVFLARPGAFPDPTGRDVLRAAVDEDPAPVQDPPLETLAGGAVPPPREEDER